MPSFIKSVLATSIEKHMVEYTVEFLHNFQTLHVVLPLSRYIENLIKRCVARRDSEMATHKMRLSVFFPQRSLLSQNSDMLANIVQRIEESYKYGEKPRR